MLITKQDGEQENFDPSKLKRSLARVGCSEGICEEVIGDVTKELKEGDSTSKIYKRAFELLREKEKPLAARYSMKRAVLALGPSGFPFEDFMSEIFRARGCQDVETQKAMQGACAPHEVDLYAKQNGRTIVAELKFHNRLGIKTDLKVALYVHARFEDLRKAETGNAIDEGWLITNTEFTSNAINYGRCTGLTLISWEYPEKGSVRNLIEETRVQPITALTTLSVSEKRMLMERRIVLCRMLQDNRDALTHIGLSEKKISEVLTEGNALCGLPKAR